MEQKRENGDWNGFRKEEFEFEGTPASLVFPDGTANSRWLLKTEYRDAFPGVEIELLKHGFHVAYLKNRTRFATRDDCDAKARFAAYLHDKRGLSGTCVPIGLSCGGAHAFNFAGFHPELTECIYVDAPVLDFSDFPGRTGDSECERVWDAEFVKAYPGVTRAMLSTFGNHPIGKAGILKQHRIPILMLYGTEDKTVNYASNGGLLEREYADAPELLTVIPRKGQGHHPHGGLRDLTPVTKFILNHHK